MEDKLKALLSAIAPLDDRAMEKARERQAELAKPPGSLGRLEDISVRLAGITGEVRNTVDKRRIIVLCADNGVAEEGVASAPQSVTAAQAVNMTRRLTGMSALAKHFGDDVQVVDMGIACPYTCPAILDRSLGKGTKNLYREPAMTREKALRAILTGAELAAQARAEGIRVVGVGEMGIGNTTTSAAVLAALTGLGVEQVTGRGGGITEESFRKKKHVISHALELHRPDPGDPVDVLSKVAASTWPPCAACSWGRRRTAFPWWRTASSPSWRPCAQGGSARRRRSTSSPATPPMRSAICWRRRSWGLNPGCC